MSTVRLSPLPRIHSFLGCALVLFGASVTEAASLRRVENWGASGVPSTVSMHIYVPDELADHPPILVLVHYCGGTAAAVFGQASGGGLVAAADRHGFVMVVPQAANPDGTGRCWDVGSNASLTRNGGGDTTAIAQMVEYTLAEYDANRERVYVTGDSSGGMTTQAILALYPDVFKAGSALAGVPAGCWAVGNPSGGWSGACAGGTVTHSPSEWGDIARALYPGYMGRRPRVQLFHGDADDIIRYPNHTEAIKQWTNVLGVSETPTSTETVQLGRHMGTRQRWENDCGFVVLDAFTSLGGDHGPSDALFLADYLVPFFGLDEASPIDPQVATCEIPSGTGGAPNDGSGGAETGGAMNTGGSATGGGPMSSLGGAPTVPSSGGAPSVGGTANGGSAPLPGTGGTGEQPSGPTTASGCGYSTPGTLTSSFALHWLLGLATAGAGYRRRKPTSTEH